MSLHLPTPELAQNSRLLWCVLICGWYAVICANNDNRLAFGFLASQEVKDAGVGNLGLWDREHLSSAPSTVLISRFQERMALRWVQKYIHSFGGDPSKVTM
jgi:acetylcholinesterase